MKTVLLVEDDDIVRGAMQMVLEWEGYRVDCARNGQEALEKLHHSEPPSLIVLDLMMPVLDGWQFREAQKADPQLASIPVVIVSGIDARYAPEAAIYVRKPFQVEELLQAVRSQPV
jgi:CheY-like chemotaxis protein